MKVGLSLLIALLLISTAAFGALDVEDFNKIREIVRESENRLRAELMAIERQQDRDFAMTLVLLACVAATVGIPLALIVKEWKRESTEREQIIAQQQQIDAQQKQIDAQQQQIDMLIQKLEARES